MVLVISCINVQPSACIAVAVLASSEFLLHMMLYFSLRGMFVENLSELLCTLIMGLILLHPWC